MRMYPLEHGLSALIFAIGFLIFFLIPLKHKTMLVLMFFFTGMAIGIHEHISYQDEHAYTREVYDSLIVNLEEREQNPWNQALCIALKNNNSKCPGKNDERWDNPFYFGE